jgi:NADPH-dependent curcumin reductase CurA
MKALGGEGLVLVGDPGDRPGGGVAGRRRAGRRRDFLTEASKWLRDGRLVSRETIVEGLDNAPGAFLGLLRGDNTGKMIVRIGPET